LDDLGVDGRILLEQIWEKCIGKVWNGFMWLRIVTNGGFLWTR